MWINREVDWKEMLLWQMQNIYYTVTLELRLGLFHHHCMLQWFCLHSQQQTHNLLNLHNTCLLGSMMLFGVNSPTFIRASECTFWHSPSQRYGEEKALRGSLVLRGRQDHIRKKQANKQIQVAWTRQGRQHSEAKVRKILAWPLTTFMTLRKTLNFSISSACPHL